MIKIQLKTEVGLEYHLCHLKTKIPELLTTETCIKYWTCKLVEDQRRDIELTSQ